MRKNLSEIWENRPEGFRKVEISPETDVYRPLKPSGQQLAAAEVVDQTFPHYVSLARLTVISCEGQTVQRYHVRSVPQIR